MRYMSIAVIALVVVLMAPGCPGPAAPPVDPGPDNGGDPAGGAPIATFTVSKIGLKANFDASGVSAPSYGVDALQVRWDFTNDGTFDVDWSTDKTTSFTYPQDGSYTVLMEVKDPANRTDSATRTFTISKVNVVPTAVFNVNVIQGMTASLDASSSSDTEDAPEDLRIRWDFDGDNFYDTDWTTTKTAEHTYATSGEYTIKLQVKDLNEMTKTATQTVIASPITIRSCFITYGNPYMIGLHFRMLNNLTGQVVTPADVPALTRAHFTIAEDNIPIDLAETNQILYSGKRPMFLVLVLDFTGSMYDAGAVIPMMNAAKAFIDSQGDTTYICLWAFWERYGGNGQIDDYTSCDDAGKAKLKSDLETFAAAYHDRGATQIWDLLKDIVTNKFPAYDTGVNRAIAFLSDGHDTTSVTTTAQLIDAARKKAISLFSMGMAFRPEEYPADEPKLKQVAEDTGGLYFTINQVGDMSTVFGQLSEDVNADWTLSYITLKSTGTHTVKAKCNYLDGYATMTGKFPIIAEIKGDIRKGLLYAFPALTSPGGKTEYTLYAGYIPRSISTIRVKVTSASPVSLTLYEDGICKPSEGWTITPDVAGGAAVPADGWYTISSITPLEYGSYGKLARCTVDATGAPAVHLELPPLVDQATVYGDKSIVFETTDTVTLDVP